MTLQQIYYAMTVSEEGSMNKASERLFITQPSLTSAIKELEREIGITIFLRTSKGVVTTNEGEDFLMRARQLYQQYELLQEQYSDKTKRKRKFGISTQHYSFAVKAFVDMVKLYDTLDFEFAFRETRTLDVIEDVGTMRSEVGILFMSEFNRKFLTKLLNDNELEFHRLIDCQAYVYLWKNHPLAKETSICFEQLQDYPCLSFEQGDKSSFYLAEEILGENVYRRVICANDRATMLNLMVGVNGYTLCSGIICEQINGSDYTAVPFKDDEINKNCVMEIGYITKKHSSLSDIGEAYILSVKNYLKINKE